MRGRGKKPENGKQRRQQRLQTPDDGDGLFSFSLNDDEELSEEQRYWQSYFEESEHLRRREKRKTGRKGKYRNRDFE
ncbi:MAG: hypothetical protein D6743_11705 [Calditrichaeota bacterium]|nr:MAG: hypothetical protein D6743_11705 [Calditrichota bacterium]